MCEVHSDLPRSGSVLSSLSHSATVISQPFVELFTIYRNESPCTQYEASVFQQDPDLKGGNARLAPMAQCLRTDGSKGYSD